MLGYSQIGHGREKVMVVHGWKTDHTCYDAMFSSLNKNKYTYVFVDQRGYGKSMNLEGPYNIEQVASDMAELAQSLEWTQYHIIGHSMGGKVIQRMMADYPECIKSAIGITPCPACEIPFDEQVWKLFSGADVNVENRRLIFQHSTGNRLTQTWYETINSLSFRMSKAEAFRAYLDSWVLYDMVEDIEGNMIPIKIIVGEYDPELNRELMLNTYEKWLPNAQVVQLDNCGHYPMMEVPLRLASEIELFLEQQSQAA